PVLLDLSGRRPLGPSGSVCRLGCMEAVAATAVTATAAAVTFSIGYLVDRRAGPAPIHRGMSRRHHATMAVTAGASTKPTTTKTPAGPSPAFFVSAIRERKMVRADERVTPPSRSRTHGPYLLHEHSKRGTRRHHKRPDRPDNT